MLKHNAYFDGKVQSIGFERNGRRATAGVIDAGMGTAFEVPAGSGFDVKATAPAAYLCEFG
jgi:purine/pyrimidine-nucleoside phosphorylase